MKAPMAFRERDGKREKEREGESECESRGRERKNTHSHSGGGGGGGGGVRAPSVPESHHHITRRGENTRARRLPGRLHARMGQPKAASALCAPALPGLRASMFMSGCHLFHVYLYLFAPTCK